MGHLRIGLLAADLIERAQTLCGEIASLSDDERIAVCNEIKVALHEVSPFRGEPVDCVIWLHSETVVANDYNPNKVAPPEMRLLEHSIAEDGYTQPIVTWLDDGQREVIDGFHRNRVGRESSKVKARTNGYLPVTTINEHRTERNDRIAATIRHNRARGKHQVTAMSEIVVDLSRRNWSDQRIGKELGMDPDEVLRLKQMSGLAELFSDREFSTAWEIDETEMLARRERK